MVSSTCRDPANPCSGLPKNIMADDWSEWFPDLGQGLGRIVTDATTEYASELVPGGFSRRRDCHSAAPSSTFSWRFNRDGERASA